MKQFFWISSVNTVENVFHGAAAILADSSDAAYGVAHGIGIVPGDGMEVVCFQLPWEERLKYKGYLHRFLDKWDMLALKIEPLKDSQQEEAAVCE